MKMNFNWRVVLGLALLLAPLAARAAAPEGARRAAAVLDYIGSDYGGAVADGKVANPSEYAEQMEFVGTVRKLLAGLEPAPDVAAGLDRLETAMKAMRPAPEVATLAQDVRRAVIAQYGVVQAPDRAPDAAHGAKLFAENCATCHAADGSGKTPVSAGFAVAPPDFRDPGAAAPRSPFRVYNTVTFGVNGTPMPAFPQLSERDRWDLAFYVTSLAHGGPKPDAAAAKLPDGFDAGLAALSSRSDAELSAALAKAGAPAGALDDLRAAAPYRVQVDGGLTTVRRYLDQVAQAMDAGNVEAARIAAIDAYLEGFEPLEARVSAIDGSLVTQVEGDFGRLRAAADKGDHAAVTAELETLRATLDGVEKALGDARATSSVGLFVASAIILLREGLEVVLLIGLLLALLGRMGRDDAKRWVHRGWMAALVAGGATWFAAGALISVSGRSREALEGIVALLAAVVLLFVSHWFLSAAEKKHWISFLRSKVATHLASGRVLPLFGLAFLAVYREVFETVLFYQALVLESPGSPMPVLAGLGAGVVGVAILAVLILRTGRKLPLGPMFTGSGIILCTLCVVFVGEGLQALREAGALAPHPVGLPAVPWLGLFPDAVGLSVQLALVLLIVGLVLVPRLLRAREPGAGKAADEA
jgi:high-affinity iron transporter